MTTKTKLIDTSNKFNRNWVWLLMLGILFVFLSFIGLGLVVGLTLLSVLMFGILLIIGGVSQLADVFNSKAWQGVVWHALIGIFYIIGGILIVYDPMLATEVITAMLAWLFIIIGLTRFIMAIMLHQGPGWGWVLFSGLISVILGLLILMQWPYSAFWVIGMFIAIEMMFCGWTYIFMALAIRRH